jgi:hypothetical protein
MTIIVFGGGAHFNQVCIMLKYIHLIKFMDHDVKIVKGKLFCLYKYSYSCINSLTFDMPSFLRLTIPINCCLQGANGLIL